MKLKNGMYLNGTLTNEIIYEEKSGEVSLNISDRTYLVSNPNNKTEYIKIENPENVFGFFNIVPGFRLIPTIEEEMEFSITYNKVPTYFEKEENIRYALNINRILTVENPETMFWRIVMIDGTEYWFKAFTENFKSFLLKLKD